MIDIKLIREQPELVKENIKRKFQENLLPLVDSILSSDESWRSSKLQIDKLRNERNTISKQINEGKKAGKTTDELKELFVRAKEIPEKIKEIEQEAEKVKLEVDQMVSKIPNMMHESVPLGKDDSENVVLRSWGEPVKKKVINHVELLEQRGLADFDISGNLSGNGFYILKGDMALLNQALIQFAIRFMCKKGYTYIEPPLMIRQKILEAAMDAEGFKDTIYRINGEDLNMIGTSEHVLLGLHTNELIQEHELPKKYFSYTMCFRKEIGAHGINEKGLWRTHQFNKVEQFIFCKPEESYKYYDELLANSEELFQALKLPYQVIECCSGDLALWKAKSADIEVWRPTTNDYGEVTSVTNCTDFQARGLQMRVVYKNGKKAILHTLNNTAVATSRAMVGIIENYQNEDGTITVPKVLRPFMGGKEKI